MRRRKRLPAPEDYDILVEGFPRSGNTYSEMMMKLTQPNIGRLYSRGHHPILLHETIRAGKPAILVIRHPRAAVLSWALSWGAVKKAEVANVLDIYINYHRALLGIVPQIAVIEFDELTKDFKGCVRTIATFWERDMRTDFEEPNAEAEAFKLIDERIVQEDGRMNEMRVNRPSQAREQAKPLIEAVFREPEIERLLAEAKALYWQVLGCRRLRRHNSKPAQFTFVSLMIDDDRSTGHLRSYQRALSRACMLNDWSHVIVCPKTAAGDFTIPAARVMPALETWSPLSRQSEWVRWPQFFRLLNGIIRSFQLIENADRAPQAAIFLENFTVRKLAAAIGGALWAKRTTEFWVLFRYGYEERVSKRILVPLLCRMYGILRPGRLRLWSDSALVAERLARLIRREVVVLPIPTLSQEAIPDRVPRPPNTYSFIWPGMPYAAKGLEIITGLLKSPLPAGMVVEFRCKKHPQLLAASNGIYVNHLPESIDDQMHWKFLSEADAILLPYDPESYASRTSGLLVEAILCGTVPFVRGPSWLSNELKRLDLTELIVEWERGDIWDYIRKCLQNEALRERFEKARRKYRDFHCLETFATILKRGVPTIAK